MNKGLTELNAGRSPLKRYGFAIVVSLLALLLRFLLLPVLGYEAPLLPLILPVVLSAWYGGLGPGLLTTLICTLAGAYLFVSPLSSLTILDTPNALRVAIFLIQGVLISGLSQALISATEHARSANQVAHESEERYRLLIEGVRDYAILMLDPDGRIVSWNSGAERLQGYAASEVLGRHFSLLYPPEAEAQKIPQQELEQALTQGRVEQEAWQHHKDGTLFWANLVTTALQDENRQPRGFSRVTRDISERRQAEQALQESYNLLQTVIEGTADAIFLKDREGRYQLANTTTARILGKPKEQILGKDDAELLPIEVATAVKAIDRTIMETGVSQTVEETVPQAGETHTFLSTKDPYRTAEGEVIGLVGVARDITDRKRAEATQQKLLKDLSDVKFALDQAAILVVTDGNGVITSVNDKFCQISQYERQELIGKTHRIVNSGYHSREFFQHLWATITAGKVWNGEVRNRAKDHSIYWVDTTIVPFLDAAGKPFQYLAIRFDITARKQAEEQLRRSLQRLESLHELDRAILTTQSIEVLTQDTLTRLIQLTTAEQGEILLVEAETPQRSVAVEAKTTAEKSTVAAATHRADCPQSSPREMVYLPDLRTVADRSPTLEMLVQQGYHSFLSTPIAIGDQHLGDLNLYTSQPAAFTTDDQEVAQETADQLAIAIQQSHLRQQLQQYAAELEQRVIDRTMQLQDVNHELEAFAYSISHDLRAPLRTIQGFAQALKEDFGDQLDTEGQEDIQFIVEGAIQMDTLIADLLSYSRLSQVEIRLQPVMLEEVVKAALKQLDGQPKEHNAEITVEPGMPAVRAHRSTLTQVLVNLIGNAIKFGDPDRPLHVRIYSEEYVQNDQDWVRLCVEDNGIGIAPEHQERIFRVFERLHGSEVYPGTGIGLAIARKGLERMGGSVGVKSHLGQGSTFWIALPKAVLNGNGNSHDPIHSDRSHPGDR